MVSMRDLPLHVEWRSGLPVTKLTFAHRHNGQTTLIRDNNGRTKRVVIDQIQTLKEYLA